MDIILDDTSIHRQTCEQMLAMEKKLVLPLTTGDLYSEGDLLITGFLNIGLYLQETFIRRWSLAQV